MEDMSKKVPSSSSQVFQPGIFFEFHGDSLRPGIGW